MVDYLSNEHVCGRLLGLRFHKRTGDLYIADAYFGLMKVGPEGGLATPLATEAEGMPLRFTNDLDVDDEGNAYFTDSSTVYQRRNFQQLVFSSYNSGPLLKYDPVADKATVLIRNVQFPNGVSISKDGSSLFYTEGCTGRLQRYWLKGGILYSRILALYPKLRDIVLSLPIKAKYQFLIHVGGRMHAVVAKYSPEGEFLEILEDRQGKVVRAVSEVEEKDGKLWLGSVLMPFMATYDLNSNLGDNTKKMCALSTILG